MEDERQPLCVYGQISMKVNWLTRTGWRSSVSLIAWIYGIDGKNYVKTKLNSAKEEALLAGLISHVKL